MRRPSATGHARPAKRHGGLRFNDNTFVIFCVVPLGLVAVGMAAANAKWHYQMSDIGWIAKYAVGISAALSLVYSLRYLFEGDDAEERLPNVPHWQFALKKALLELIAAGLSGGVVTAYRRRHFQPEAVQARSHDAARPLPLGCRATPILSTSGAAMYVVLGVPLILFALICRRRSSSA